MMTTKCPLRAANTPSGIFFRCYLEGNDLINGVEFRPEVNLNVIFSTVRRAWIESEDGSRT